MPLFRTDIDVPTVGLSLESQANQLLPSIEVVNWPTATHPIVVRRRQLYSIVSGYE